jgi:hypothetical protein
VPERQTPLAEVPYKNEPAKQHVLLIGTKANASALRSFSREYLKRTYSRVWEAVKKWGQSAVKKSVTVTSAEPEAI